MASTATRLSFDRQGSQADQGAATPYDRLLEALEEAIVAIDSVDACRRRKAIQSAAEALTALYLDLDVKESGQNVDGLANFYGYLIGRLLRANLYGDRGILRNIIELLEPLRESGATLDTLVAEQKRSVHAELAVPTPRTAA